MKWVVLVGVLATCAFGTGGELDSLMQKTEKLKSVKGFVYQQQQKPVELVSPEILFGTDKPKLVPRSTEPLIGIGTPGGGSSGLSGLTGHGSGSSHNSQQYVSFREFFSEIRSLDEKIIRLQVDAEKMLTVLENLHESGKNTRDGVNVAIKLVEVVAAVAASIIAVASAFVAYSKIKSSKS